MARGSDMMRPVLGRNVLGRNELGRNELGRNELGRNELGRIESARDQLGCGTRVEVRNHFVSSWSDGFEVTRVDGDGYRVRRVSDRVELPATFTPDDVRPLLAGR